MTLLIATAKAVDANSFLTLARANEILRSRLYTTAWDNAASTPSAEGYVSTGIVASGLGTVAVITGAGTFTAGTVFKFAGHATEYTVSTALAAPGNLVFTPVLTAGVAAGEAVVRLTASSREKALIWATRLLDGMMAWQGSVRTYEQSLRWPRSGVLKKDGDFWDYDTIPSVLEEATADLALVLLDKDKFSLPSIVGQGFSKAKVGPLEVTVDQKQIETVIPQNILTMLSELGQLSDHAGPGFRIARLLRT